MNRTLDEYIHSFKWFTIYNVDPWKPRDNHNEDNYKRFTGLRVQHPNLKVEQLPDICLIYKQQFMQWNVFLIEFYLCACRFPWPSNTH